MAPNKINNSMKEEETSMMVEENLTSSTTTSSSSSSSTANGNGNGNGSDILSFQTATEHSHYPLKEGVNTFFNLKVKAGEFTPDEQNKRKPLDLRIVLDKSGSMRGVKLDLCKATIEFLASQLNDDDTLGITIFDSNVKSYDLLNMTNAGKKKIESILDSIQAGTCTNLSGGLLKGVDDLLQYSEQNSFERMERIQSVFLLTDGHANEGICDPSELINVLDAKLASNRDMKIYTFGYGSDHSVNLLQRIGECGHGGYYFIEKNSEVAQTFSDCLGGLLSVVAQNININITTSTEMEITPIPGQKAITVNNVIPLKSYALQVNDIFAGEEKDILFEIKLPPLEGNASIMDWNAAMLRYDYTDMRTEPSTNVQMETNLLIPRLNDDDLVSTTVSISPEVVTNRLRLRTVQALKEANTLATAGKLDEARKLLRNLRSNIVETRESIHASITTAIQNGQDDTLKTLNGLIQDIDECVESMANMNQWRSKGVFFVQTTANENTYQRSCKASSRFENSAKTAAKVRGSRSVAMSKYVSKDKGKK